MVFTPYPLNTRFIQAYVAGPGCRMTARQHTQCTYAVRWGTPRIFVVPSSQMNTTLQSRKHVLSRTLRLRRLWIDRSQLEYHAVRFFLWLAYFGCVLVLFLMALSSI